MSEDNAEANLAQEFKDYLRIISNEISDPLKEQVRINSECTDRMFGVAEKFDEDLQKNIKLNVAKSLSDLNEQVINIYHRQQADINKNLEIINQGLQKKIESYEEKTTQRLMNQRWIETLIITLMIALLFIFK
jgi:hypothetical protein